MNGQVERLDAVPGFRMSDTGRKELAAWLSTQSGVDHPEKHDHSIGNWIKSNAGGRIKAVMDECVEFTTPPGLADIKAVWYWLYPPISTHEKCGACGGTGWQIVNRAGKEGAVRCVGAAK